MSIELVWLIVLVLCFAAMREESQAQEKIDDLEYRLKETENTSYDIDDEDEF